MEGISMNSKTYDLLKQVAQIWLPALGSAYFSLAGIWGFPSPEDVVGTIVVIDTFLGVVLHISTQSYNQSDRKYDGSFNVEEGPDGSQLRMTQVDMEGLLTKDSITFKLNKVPQPDLAG
jgi:hypothetical protein